jgi:hypothetical protein
MLVIGLVVVMAAVVGVGDWVVREKFQTDVVEKFNVTTPPRQRQVAVTV